METPCARIREFTGVEALEDELPSALLAKAGAIDINAAVRRWRRLEHWLPKTVQDLSRPAAGTWPALFRASIIGSRNLFEI